MSDADSQNGGGSTDGDVVRIVPFDKRYREAFRSLNEEWITRHFQVEPADRKVLDEPESNIIEPGGYIFVALVREEVVGVCALVKLDNDTFELAKMAVSPRAQGKGIGRQLGAAAIARASSEGARRIYLESNTKLERAMALYRRLGFVETSCRPSPYTRCNIHMELSLR